MNPVAGAIVAPNRKGSVEIEFISGFTYRLATDDLSFHQITVHCFTLNSDHLLFLSYDLPADFANHEYPNRIRLPKTRS